MRHAARAWVLLTLGTLLATGCASGGTAVGSDPNEERSVCRMQATPDERARLYSYSTPPLLLNLDQILLSMVPQADWDEVPDAPDGTLVLAVLVDARGGVSVAEVRRSSGDGAVDGRFQQALCTGRYQPATRYAGARLDQTRRVPAWIEVRVEWDEEGAVHLTQSD